MAQTATATGNNNLIIQIDGDGNTVNAALPHLRLTRYLNDRLDEGVHIERDADLLNARAMSIPLVGREDALAELDGWLDGGLPIAVRVVTGRAGSGKTRLAMELCDLAINDKGWFAGFVTDRELERFGAQQNLAAWGWQKPTLMVIDYAAARAGLLNQWLAELADNPHQTDDPLRVLLLERHADATGGWWQQALGQGGGDARAIRRLLDPDTPVPLPALERAVDRRGVLAGTLERMNSLLRPPAPGADAEFDRRLATVDWGGDPLFLMMAALVAHTAGFAGTLSLSRVDLAERLAEDECARIGRVANSAGVNGDLLCHMAAFMTLCQGLAGSDALAAIAGETAALGYTDAPAEVATALARVLPTDEGRLEPLQPDMLGEAVILRAMAPLDEDAGGDAVLRAAGCARERVAATVIRAAQDFAIAERVRPLAWLERLAQAGAADIRALMELANLLPEHTTVLRRHAAALHGTIVEMLRTDRLGMEADTHKGFLATALNNLGAKLDDLGRREDALAAAEEALAIRRDQAVRNPDAFRPDLATSLNNLGNTLDAVGRREDALAATGEAVEIHRDLAARNPDAFRPRAIALDDFGDELS